MCKGRDSDDESSLLKKLILIGQQENFNSKGLDS
jgi:hypothetical protein